MGVDVTIFEYEDQLGGRFGIGKLGDRKVMFGGKNIGKTYSTFRQITDDLGSHAYESFGYNASRLRNGQLITIDSDSPVRTLRSIHKMGTTADLFRLAKLLRMVRSADDAQFVDSRTAHALADRSDQQTLGLHFSSRLTENLLRPVTVRQNGAEPHEVHLGTFLPNFASMLDSYDQLVEGVEPVFEHLASKSTILTGARIESLEYLDNSVVLEASITGEQRKRLEFDVVVLALPAHAAASLLTPHAEDLGAELSQILYSPATVALVEYDRDVFRPDVRAITLDGPCSNVGCYGREELNIARFTFSGSEAREQNPTRERIDTWIEDAESALSDHLHFEGASKKNVAVRHWPRALCGFSQFHPRRLQRINRLMNDLPRVGLAGDYMKGTLIEACVRSGSEAADRVMRYDLRTSLAATEGHRPTPASNSI